MTSFGKRNAQSGNNGFSAVERRGVYANNSIVDRQQPSQAILPSIHDTHLERYWPRYVAACFALYAAYYFHFEYGNNSIASTLFGSIVAGLFSYFGLNGFRKSVNNLYLLRSGKRKTKAFRIGALLGALYWIYSTFVAPSTIMGVEFGPQTVFYDGFQREDLAAVAQLLLSFGGYAIAGGLIVQFFAKRVFPNSDAAENAL